MIEWTAGFLEGEGSFILCGNTPRIAAPNCDPEMLDRLKDVYGGSVNCQHRRHRPGQENWNDLYQWNLTGKAAIDLMKAIYPLMSVKRRDQIDRVLDRRLVLEDTHPRMQKMVTVTPALSSPCG